MTTSRTTFEDADGDQLAIGTYAGGEPIVSTTRDGVIVTRQSAPLIVRALLAAVGLTLEDLR